METVDQFLTRQGAAVHLMGVGGVGMAGLAFLLKARGFHVNGCDLASDTAVVCWLAEHGVTVQSGHHPSHLDGSMTALIRSAAVPATHPEVVAAQAAGIPVFARGEVLPALLAGQASVAIGGTHGKTTTATFITCLLKTAGRDPSWCIGGESERLGGVAGQGRGGCLVVEADESDGTLALYRPDIAVITNIEFDHMEHFTDVAAFERCFCTFADGAQRRVIACADDPRAYKLLKAHPRALFYGFSEAAVVRGEMRDAAGGGVSFTVWWQGRRMGEVVLAVPGRHNVLNALAAVAVGLEMGLDFSVIQSALAEVRLPRRRFELVAEWRGVRVVSDYAHHPSEIAALVAAARTRPARRLAVFQPHRYTRTRALGADFPLSFRGVDEVVLVPVYAASEAPLAGGSVWDLYAHFRAAQIAGDRRVPLCRVAGSLRQAWEYACRWLKPGSELLVVGAGSVEQLACWAKDAAIAEEGADPGVKAPAIEGLSGQTVVRVDEPLAGKTTYRVGGCADLWADVASVADLQVLSDWTRRRGLPFMLLGGGSNLLVSDLGVRGMVARLRGGAFTHIGPVREGEVVVGAAVGTTALLNCLEKNEWGGMEFLEGIPGTVGGCVRMNAGAWGDEIARHVVSVRCLDADGRMVTLAGDDLQPQYRLCGGLKNCIVIDVVLRLEHRAAADIHAQRVAVAARRKWMQGLRCAGSVFKNPNGDYAGRLIEAAGLKGFAVGGVRVSEQHANIFVAEVDAAASDVRAVMELVRIKVAADSGVMLEPEIVVWGE